MNSFDRVIGYENIKAEMMQIVDMLNNREKYRNLGARMPRGVLMYGRPGLGKTLVANAFIEECGLPCYTVRRKDAGPGFTKEISKAFAEARDNAPAVVFLDDLDKFSNGDSRHKDAEEYVAVQSCIDESAGSDIFVIATANNICKLPDSLRRTGRFDLKIHFSAPDGEDAKKIIRYYLSDKKLSDDVNLNDLVRMMSYSSCSELETILNDAAIRAAHSGKTSIEMKDLIASVLAFKYHIGSSWNLYGGNSGYDDGDDDFFNVDSDDDNGGSSGLRRTPEESRKVALHEAGHLVVSEIIKKGSVGFATIRSDGSSNDGFVHYADGKNMNRRECILTALAGKAAEELYYSETCASGCSSDISTASDLIRDGIEDSGTHGFGAVDTGGYASDDYRKMVETLTRAELEKNMFKVRDIILKNRDFLEKTADALMKQDVLLSSDIKKIRESVTIVPCAA